MTEPRFNLIFEGKAEPGHIQEGIRCTLESLFAIDTDIQIDFFSGQPVVLAENMNAATANSFKQALADSGIVTYLLASNEAFTDEDVKSQRLVQRRKNNGRRARVRCSAILPDRRQDLDCRQ